MTDSAALTPANDSPLDPDDGFVLAGGGEAADLDKIEGIIAQTRSDYPGTDLDEITERLRQRFEQSRIPIVESELREYAKQVADAAV